MAIPNALEHLAKQSKNVKKKARKAKIYPSTSSALDTSANNNRSRYGGGELSSNPTSALDILANNYRSKNGADETSSNPTSALDILANNYTSKYGADKTSFELTMEDDVSRHIQAWFDSIYEIAHSDNFSDISDWKPDGESPYDELLDLQQDSEKVGKMISDYNYIGFSLDDYNKYYNVLTELVNVYKGINDYYDTAFESVEANTGSFDDNGQFSYNDPVTTYENIQDMAASLDSDAETILDEYLYGGAGSADYSSEDAQTQETRSALSDQIDYYISQMYGTIGSSEDGEFTFNSASEIVDTLKDLQTQYDTSSDENEKGSLATTIDWIYRFLGRAESNDLDEETLAQLYPTAEDREAAINATNAYVEKLYDEDMAAYRETVENESIWEFIARALGGAVDTTVPGATTTYGKFENEDLRVELSDNIDVMNNDEWYFKASEALADLDPEVRANVEAAYNGDDAAQAYVDNYFKDDPHRADEYRDYVEAITNKEKAEEQSEAYAEWASKNVFNNIVASAAAVGASLLTPGGLVETIKSFGYESEDRPIDINSNWFWAQRFRESVTGAVMEDIDSQAGKMAYAAGMAIADSAALVGLTYATGGALGLSGAALTGFSSTVSSIIMGSQVAANTVYTGIQNGYSNEKAITMGLIYAGIEIMTEKIGLDKVLGAAGTITGKNALIRAIKTTWKAGIAEGGEEVVSDILGGIVDVIANADQSQLSQTYQNYIASGMSSAEAMYHTVLDLGGQTLFDFAGGFFGGALISGISTGVGGGKVRTVGNAAFSQGTLQATLDYAALHEMTDFEGFTTENIGNLQAGEVTFAVQQDISQRMLNATTMEELTAAVSDAAAIGDESFFEYIGNLYNAKSADLTGEVQELPESMTANETVTSENTTENAGATQESTAEVQPNVQQNTEAAPGKLTGETRRGIVNTIQSAASVELLNETYKKVAANGNFSLSNEAGKAYQARMKQLTGRVPVAAEYAQGHINDGSEIGNLYIYGISSEGGSLRLETSHGIREISDVTLKNGVTAEHLQQAYNYGLMGVNSLDFGNSRLPQSQLTRMAYEQGLADAKAAGNAETKGAGDTSKGGTESKVLNNKGIPYPEVEVKGYGIVEFPAGPYVPSNSRALRPHFTDSYKKQFKEWWIEQGRPWPEGEVNIHHIKPLSKGGDNSFENLIPLIQPEEHQPFTNWWRNYP